MKNRDKIQLNKAYVYLDDTRPAPSGWHLCRWPEEVIELIKQGGVEAVDHDHDLGEGSEYANPRTGEDVLKFLEEWVHDGHEPPRIMIHTMNAAKRVRMIQTANAIMSAWSCKEQRKEEEENVSK
jgi:hypothetical protein